MDDLDHRGCILLVSPFLFFIFFAARPRGRYLPKFDRSGAGEGQHRQLGAQFNEGSARRSDLSGMSKISCALGCR